MADIADDPTPPTPGSATAAVVTHIVLQVLAATLSSLIAAGVFPDGSTGFKVAAIIVANLAALGYGQKTAQVTARAAVRAAVRRGSVLVLALGAGAVMTVTLNACAGAPKPLATFGTCTVSSLEADVGNGTLLTVVEKALLADDYAGAIAGLVAKLGEDEVACAVLAIDEVFGAPAPAAGSGSAARVALASESLLRQRAADVIAKRGWRPGAAARR